MRRRRPTPASVTEADAITSAHVPGSGVRLDVKSYRKYKVPEVVDDPPKPTPEPAVPELVASERCRLMDCRIGESPPPGAK